MITTSNPPGRTVEPAFAAPAQLTPERLESLRAHFERVSAWRLAQNAVTQTAVEDVAMDREILNGLGHTFSHLLDDWEVTHQKKSGRCWMFAALNLFRAGAMAKMNLKNFEFSQNYTLFWDKLERSNYILEAIIETARDDVDDRTVAFLLSRPLDDGGQWNMFVNLVAKHGVVPKEAMPETHSSSDTHRMNSILIAKLREGARILRGQAAAGGSAGELRRIKHELLEVIYRILCIHLGTPPTRLFWQWNDKDKVFHRDGEMTPLEFAGRYITVPLDEYVCLVHDPRESSPYGRTFTVKYLGNVVGGARVVYLNIEMPLMKQIAMQAICEGEPVWFGCDVGKMMRRDLGLWDARLFDYERVYETTFGLDKADRLVYHQTMMTHAMVFTGVDVVGDRPRRWRVENSWGDELGKKGFFVMNDSWFDEYVFEIAARKSRLPEDLQKAVDEEPIELDPWDPMGSLAG